MVNTVRLVSSLSRVQGFELANAADCLINTSLQRGAVSCRRSTNRFNGLLHRNYEKLLKQFLKCKRRCNTQLKQGVNQIVKRRKYAASNLTGLCA